MIKSTREWCLMCVIVIAINNHHQYYDRSIWAFSYHLSSTVPEAVDLEEFGSTTDSITAQWPKPNGIVQSYNVSCDKGGTPSEVTTLPSQYLSASCMGLPIPGDDYRMEVIAVSSGQQSQLDSINITASMYSGTSL